MAGSEVNRILGKDVADPEEWYVVDGDPEVVRGHNHPTGRVALQVNHGNGFWLIEVSEAEYERLSEREI